MPDFLQAAVDYTDSDFNAEDLRHKILSIQLRLDGFSFVIVDISNKQLLKLQDFKTSFLPNTSDDKKWEAVTNLIKKYLNQRSIDINTFVKIVLIIDHKEYTLMPKALFLKDKIKDYLLFNQNISYSFDVLSHIIDTTDKVMLFAVSVPLRDTINEYFPQSTLKHKNSVLLLAILKSHKNRKTDKSIYVSVSRNIMHIIAMDNDILLMCNSYSFTSKEDFIYFILLSYDQLGLNPKSDALFLLGDINKSTPIFQICWQYVKNISFIDQLSEISAGPAFDQMPTHQYYTLIQSTLCE